MIRFHRTKWSLVWPLVLSSLCVGVGCQKSSSTAPSEAQAQEAELLRQMEEAHARLGDPEPETEVGAAEESPGLSERDFARFEGELRCISAHFGEDTRTRERAETRLMELWSVRPEWATEQRQRLAQKSKQRDLVGRISQQHFDQVCPGGQASAPFLAQLGH